VVTLATFNGNNFFLHYKFAVAAADINLGYISEKKFGKCLSSDLVIWDPLTQTEHDNARRHSSNIEKDHRPSDVRHAMDQRNA